MAPLLTTKMNRDSECKVRKYVFLIFYLDMMIFLFQLITYTGPTPWFISQSPDWIWRHHVCHWVSVWRGTNIYYFLLWFYDLIFPNQILTHQPCHDSYPRPRSEYGDTTFILPTWTEVKSSARKGKVRQCFLPIFYIVAHIFTSISFPRHTSSDTPVLRLNPREYHHLPHTKNNRKQGLGQVRWGCHSIFTLIPGSLLISLFNETVTPSLEWHL